MANWPLKFTGIANAVKGNVAVDPVPAGMVGETLVAEQTTANALTLFTTAPKDAVSITLPPGEWSVFGTVGYKANALTVINRVQQGISGTSNTFDGMGTYTAIPIGATIGSDVVVNTPPVVMSVNAGQTKTVYLVAQAFFTISSASTYGKISARRVR